MLHDNDLRTPHALVVRVCQCDLAIIFSTLLIKNPTERTEITAVILM